MLGVTFMGGKARQGADVIPASVVAPLLPSSVHDSDAPTAPADPVFMQPYTRHTSRFLICFITFLPFALWPEFYWYVPLFGRDIRYTVVLGCGNAKSSQVTIRCALLQADHPRHGCFHILARWWVRICAIPSHATPPNCTLRVAHSLTFTIRSPCRSGKHRRPD
jgi:hypothetical protein